ncbi:MAG: hypothetical protein IJ563_05930 [Selenomonadaceae bacterium]|nr:hypothetical protein [Selenomonadaceae bacterium]MBR1859556.1 hypothetical protein [Selenomonadaceae bacterium]
MKKIFSIFMAVLLFMAVENLAEAANIKDHPAVAVMQFTDKAIKSNVEGIRGQDFSSAAEYAIVQLNASNWFDLVDYEQMTAIAKMISMYDSGLFDQSAAPMLGKFAAAQYVLVGSLTGITAKKSDAVVMSKHSVTVNVTLKLVDVETLKIVGTGMGTGKSSSSKAEITFKPFRNKPGYIGVRQVNINVNNSDVNPNVNANGVITMDDPSFGTYYIKVDKFEVDAVCVRNALSKAVRDAIYGDSGILTNLNGGKKLNVKTDF